MPNHALKLTAHRSLQLDSTHPKQDFFSRTDVRTFLRTVPEQDEPNFVGGVTLF